MKHINYRPHLRVPDNSYELCKGFIKHTYTLDELGFPSHEKLYQSVVDIEKEIGLGGFRTGGHESDVYRGFSLVYNPKYKGTDCSIYHQTMGDTNIESYYSRADNNLTYGGIDSYYDSYGFTHRLPLIEKHFGNLFNQIYGAVIRSRVSYLYSSLFNFNDPKMFWHIDEFPYEMLRLIIPVKTSDNFVIRMSGDDKIGNYTDLIEFCPKLGECYMWNNGIPHQMAPLEIRDDPRIYIIIGFSPWFNYENGEYVPNDNYGYPIQTIVENQLFLQ